MLIILLMVVPTIIWIYETGGDKTLYTKYKRYRSGLEYLANRDYAVITFEQFKTCYYLNPDAYEDDDYSHRRSKPTFGVINYYDNDSKTKYRLAFSSFADYLKYVRFLKCGKMEFEAKQKIQRQLDIDKNTAKYYAAVMKDIARLKAQANGEIRQAIEMMQSATNSKSILEGFDE